MTRDEGSEKTPSNERDLAIISELRQLADNARASAAMFKSHDESIKKLYAAASEIGKAWSQGWIGYHARVYKKGFAPVRPGEHWDTMWGALDAMSNTTFGQWAEYAYEAVVEEIEKRAGNPDIEALDATAVSVGKKFDQLKDEAVAILAAVAPGDDFLMASLKKIEAIHRNAWANEFLKGTMPKQVMTRDPRAQNRIETPPHLGVQANCYEQSSYAIQCNALATELDKIAKYLATRSKFAQPMATITLDTSSTGSTMAKTSSFSILFLDLVGWSKLRPPQVTAYLEKGLVQLDTIVRTKHRAVHLNTWGDAIVATFNSVREAAECALDIRDFFRRASESDGIPQGLVPRISLHVGEIITAYNPMIGRDDIFGDAVHLTARLEPVTPRGQVYCTDTFAVSLRGIAGLAPVAHAIGEVELAKAYGTVKVFAVTGPNEEPPAAVP